MAERALLYVRISELTDATTSPERQLAECQAYADRMGWEVVPSPDGLAYQDLDISGTKGLGQRPHLSAALEAIERGEATRLIAYKIDRVARSVVTFHEVVARVQAAGASLVLVAESLDFATAAGRMVANVLASFAQFESETIGQRVKAAKAHLTSQGKWPGGRRPFGWQPVEHESGKGYRLALDATEGPILREMVDRVLAGEAVNSLAADLNRREVTTVLGHEWVGETVRKALTKPAMIGRNGADRLVSDREYARLQAQLSRRAPNVAQHELGPVLLPPSVVSCGRCGSPMRAATHGAGDKARRVYRCSQRPAPGSKDGCYLIAVAEHVDAIVQEYVLDLIGSMPTAVLGEPEMVDPAAEERAEIVEAMGELEEDRYVRRLFKGPDGAARFATRYADLERMLAELPEPYTVEPEPGEVIPTGELFATSWEAADLETRQGWLAQMLDAVEVAPGKGGRKFDRERVTIRLARGERNHV